MFMLLIIKLITYSLIFYNMNVMYYALCNIILLTIVKMKTFYVILFKIYFITSLLTFNY